MSLLICVHCTTIKYDGGFLIFRKRLSLFSKGHPNLVSGSVFCSSRTFLVGDSMDLRKKIPLLSHPDGRIHFEKGGGIESLASEVILSSKKFNRLGTRL